MEDSFRVRVDKVFGSLVASASASTSASASSSASSWSSSSLSSLWCLTDEEIERREWNREKASADDNEPKPYPPNLDGFFANQQQNHSSQTKPPLDLHQQLEFETDLQDLEDDDDEEDDDGKKGKRRQLVKPDDHDDEAWDIRSSIGLDCTLDKEEEEDEYDKVAVGTEKTDDHLYMRDVTSYWTDINFYDEIPNTFKDATRDPRANHMAAKLRLKEDAEAAGKFDSLKVSDTELLVTNTQSTTLEEVVNLKSILKRKDNQIDPKTQKRVRFGPGCKNDSEDEYEGTKDVAMDSCLTEAEISETSFPSQECYGVPDYIQNPSKYTHYTFDSSSDIDEESNRKAYMDFLNQLKSPHSTEPQPTHPSGDLPKSITFTPRKKLGDASMLMLKDDNEFKQNQRDVGKEFMGKKGGPIVVAAWEARESEVCEMEEDEPEKVATKNSSLRRQGRQYRTKATDEGLDEPIT